MNSRIRLILWFAVPFVLAMAALATTRSWLVSVKSAPQRVVSSLPAHNASAIVGHTLSVADLIEAQSRAPIAEQGLTVPDSAVVILLGGVGCSADQVKLLRYWSEQHAETDLQDHPIVAIYADPMLGIEQGAYESLLLRRVSQAKFPFLVSKDPDFNPRAMGIRTPQVVLAESQVITHVLDLPAVFRPPALQ